MGKVRKTLGVGTKILNGRYEILKVLQIGRASCRERVSINV